MNKMELNESIERIIVQFNKIKNEAGSNMGLEDEERELNKLQLELEMLE